MRALLPLIVCLSMAVYVIADLNVLTAGQRQEGDSLFLSRKIKKSAHDVAVATWPIRAPVGEVVNYVKVTNVVGNNVKVQLVNDVGSRFILGVAVGPRGEKIELEVEAYSTKSTHADS